MVNKISSLNAHIAAFAANLCATGATCVMSWSSPTKPMITKPGSKIYLSETEAVWLMSVAALGAFFGPLITGSLVDCLGRKRTLLAANLLFLVTWGVLYYFETYAIMLCARFASGLGVGCVYSTLPMYIAEIAPLHLRESLGSFLQLFDCIAYLIEYIVGSYVSYENLILVSATLPLICFLSFMWIPESPYHLQHKGRKEEALEALRFFRDHAEISTLKRDIADLEASEKNIKDNEGSWSALFQTTENLKYLYYGFALILFQQGSGINVVTFYSKSIFEESGSSFSPNLSSVIVASVMTVTSIVPITCAKFLKIKQMLYFSAIGNTISMITLGNYYYFYNQRNPSRSLDWLPVTCLVFFIFSYTIGFGPLVWVVTAAIFPSHLKAISCALTASLMWLFTFVLTTYYSFMEKSSAFLLFGGISFLSFFFVLFQLPDTQGKTFQEIQDMIEGEDIELEDTTQTQYVSTF